MWVVADFCVFVDSGGEWLVACRCVLRRLRWLKYRSLESLCKRACVASTPPTQGCRPLDLLPSLLAGQCADCNAVMSLRDVQVGAC